MIVMQRSNEGCVPRWRCDACGGPMGEHAEALYSEPYGVGHLPTPYLVCGPSCRTIGELTLTARPLLNMPLTAFKKMLGAY